MPGAGIALLGATLGAAVSFLLARGAGRDIAHRLAGARVAADTNTDLLYGALGSAVGAALLVYWAHRGWGAMRRVPRDALIVWFGDPEAELDGDRTQTRPRISKDR